MAGSKLWTPSGEVPIAERDVIPITAKELQMLSILHEFAHKYQITVVCKRCDSSLQGKNNGHETVSAGVACQCREFRFTR